MKPSSRPPMSKKHATRVFLSAMCMGAADLVPGVSGGTMAFITGIYEELISAVKSVNVGAAWSLLTGRWKRLFDQVHWQFLLFLLTGMFVSVMALSQLVHFLLNEPECRVSLYAFFLGLILASVRFCMKQVDSWSTGRLGALFTGLVLALFLSTDVLSYFVREDLYDVHVPLSQVEQVSNYDVDSQYLKNVPASLVSAMLSKGIISPSATLYSQKEQLIGPARDFIWASEHGIFEPRVMACGALAICAMLLPGISGSYLLLILGMYGIVIAALSDFTSALKSFSFDWQSFTTLANLGIGMLIGAVLFSRVISWTFSRHRTGTISLLTGFMLGALWAFWPFWNVEARLLPLKLDRAPQLYHTTARLPDWTSGELMWSLVYIGAGFALVTLMELVSKKDDKFDGDVEF